MKSKLIHNLRFMFIIPSFTTIYIVKLPSIILRIHAEYHCGSLPVSLLGSIVHTIYILVFPQAPAQTKSMSTLPEGTKFPSPCCKDTRCSTRW